MSKRSRRRERDLSIAPCACPSCGASIAGRHCAECGELRPDLRPDGARELLANLFESLTSVDGKFVRSLRTLLFRPGVATAEFLRGARRDYVTPIQGFLVANVFFFVVQAWLDWNSLRTPLRVHLKESIYSPWAREHVRAFALDRGTTVEALAEAFDARVETYSKSLLVLLVPMFAVGVAILCRGRTRGALGALTFSLHVYTAYLWFQAGVVLPISHALTLGWIGSLHWTAIDTVTTSLVLGVLTVYDTLALRAAFGFGTRAAIFRAIALTFAFGVAWFGYRFVLFLIVLHTLPTAGS